MIYVIAILAILSALFLILAPKDDYANREAFYAIGVLCGGIACLLAITKILIAIM